MSDTTGTITGSDASMITLVNRKPWKVAYTLNNAQPVSCTIIGNQPMFYLDFEEDFADPSFLDGEEIAILEKEVSKLKREIEEFDRFTNFLNEEEDQKFQSILDNSASFSQKAEAMDDFSSASFMAQTIKLLEQSRTAKAYLEFGAKHNLEIKASMKVETAEYDRRSGLILVNPSLDIRDAVLLTARELRRHWQHRHGALINPLVFQPDNAVLLNRLQCADLTTALVRTAWELQLSGHKEVWERLEDSPMADLARAFAREAFLDFRTINNGVANAAVVESWFLSDRCKAEDKALIQQMLVDAQGYVFESNDAMRSVTAELISALGTMPFGKNYLAHHTMTILDDPIFNEVRDRSNANFLWFIKFERSFRESEHELQNGESSSGRTSGTSKTSSSGSNHAKPQNADIISFQPKQDNAGSVSEQGVFKAEQSGKPVKSTDADDGQNIIYLRRWSGE